MVYKCVANINTAAYRQKKMNTQMKLDVEEVREFVGEFKKFFEVLKAWTKDAEQIKAWREFFEKNVPQDVWQFF